MRRSDYLIVDLKVNYWLKKGLSRFVGILQQNLDTLKNMLAYIGLGINIIILFSYSDDIGDRVEDPLFSRTSVETTELILRILGIISTILLFWIAFLSIFNIVPQYIKGFQIRTLEEEKKLKELGQTSVFDRSIEPLNKVRSYVHLLYQMITDLRIIYYLSLFFVTFIGVLYHPFFYTFLLSFFVSRRKALMNVLKAIIKPGVTLALTILLMFMVIYGFTVFSYTYYHSDYGQND
mmetsp:Transcript_29139/g.25775  ORF Transcript_29139/g.25775 Transcript_29139/m.25775 type:complete len:235 (+) Transcript_29139:781-1485(+)